MKVVCVVAAGTLGVSMVGTISTHGTITMLARAIFRSTLAVGSSRWRDCFVLACWARTAPVVACPVSFIALVLAVCACGTLAIRKASSALGHTPESCLARLMGRAQLRVPDHVLVMVVGAVFTHAVVRGIGRSRLVLAGGARLPLRTRHHTIAKEAIAARAAK
jgi:hypothetical protein